MKVKSLLDLFIHDLSDVYSAEKQITRALPKLVRAASDESLKTLFSNIWKRPRDKLSASIRS